MLQAAAELKKAGVAFKLIDNKEYFHHCVGALRASVFPGMLCKMKFVYKARMN
jgi:hypothetical protein